MTPKPLNRNNLPPFDTEVLLFTEGKIKKMVVGRLVRIDTAESSKGLTDTFTFSVSDINEELTVKYWCEIPKWPK